MFCVTLPVEPLYRTASEVATLSYIRERTVVPIPRVIVHSSTTDNGLGFEWILVGETPDVSLKTCGAGWIWRGRGETRVVAQYVKQLQDQCSFDMIGNLYFRKDRRSVKTRTFRVFKEMSWNFSLKMPIFAGEYGREKPQRTASSGRFIARAHTVGTTVHYG